MRRRVGGDSGRREGRKEGEEEEEEEVEQLSTNWSWESQSPEGGGAKKRELRKLEMSLLMPQILNLASFHPLGAIVQ